MLESETALHIEQDIMADEAMEETAKASDGAIKKPTKTPFKVVTDPSRDSLLTDFGKETLSDRYLLPGEDYQGMFARVAGYYGEDPAHAQRLYDYMSRHWFMPATPVLSNGGTDRGLPISCFVGSVQDSLKDIRRAWDETVCLASAGGGVGSYWGRLRSIGEKVSGRGKTSGVIPFIRVMDSLTLAISQGSLRRGSAAVYLPVWHPEIEEFIEIRRPTGGDPSRKSLNLHHGVSIPDKFMEAVEAGADWDLISPLTGKVIRTIKARDLWVRILTARLEQGEPYILYIDRVNEYRPIQQKILNLEVETSNLCVAPDTKILTKKGNVEIQSVADSYQSVWNGQGWSTAYVAKTGTNQKMTRVTFSNGKSVVVTGYHNFYITTPEVPITRVSTKELQVGDTLIDWLMPDGTKVSGVKVVELERDKFVTDTYCFNEPARHMGIFNGILTGNCSEITLPTGPDQFKRNRTAVCCLSSLNMEMWSEWKDNEQFIDDVMLFLDNILQDFIDRAPDTMADAVYSATRERSVGLGVMGFAGFLQKNMIPFESALAKSYNRKIFKHIRTRADKASVKWARIRGACPDAADVGIEARWSNKMAVAPTATISIICGGTSPGIEPLNANVFTQKTLSGSFIVRNKHLETYLRGIGKDTPEVWSSITASKGSVQHLDFIPDDVKDVFKTAFELDPRWYIEHAADRAPFVCQAVSNNLFLPANIHKRDLHMIHFTAWKKGVKSLYYCRSLSINRAENMSAAALEKVDLGTIDNGRPLKNTPESVDYDECLACQ